MATAQASKDEIIDRLFTVFRDRGFEGASITDLSRATGLGKSSLYHHFPDGKEQMAEAVLERATAVIDSEILNAARSSGTLKARIRKIVATLDQMYVGGRAPACSVNSPRPISARLRNRVCCWRFRTGSTPSKLWRVKAACRRHGRGISRRTGLLACKGRSSCRRQTAISGRISGPWPRCSNFRRTARITLRSKSHRHLLMASGDSGGYMGYRQANLTH